MNVRIAALTLALTASGATPVSAQPLAPLPDGWAIASPTSVAGSSSHDYTVGVDAAVMHDGHPSAYIGSLPAASQTGFGTFMQTISASAYAGKRIRFSAMVKTQAVTSAGLWMRVDDKRTTVRFDNMQNRPIVGTTDWKAYSVVLDVPSDAVSISFGLLEVGRGEAWLNDVAFGVTTSDVPTTDIIDPGTLPKEPRNLTF